MIEHAFRPTLNRYEDIDTLVGELQRLGLSASEISQRIVEQCVIDLDDLGAALRARFSSPAKSVIAA